MCLQTLDKAMRRRLQKRMRLPCADARLHMLHTALGRHLYLALLFAHTLILAVAALDMTCMTMYTFTPVGGFCLPVLQTALVTHTF